jgi:hypothetical protein
VRKGTREVKLYTKR